MIQELSMQSFGPISQFETSRFGRINLFIGRNGTGKTYALKALYAAQKSVEQYRRGDAPTNLKDLLFHHLYWTFQVKQLSQLVRKGESQLSFQMKSELGASFQYSFGTSTNSEIKNVESTYEPSEENTIFIPAKEVISLQECILKLHDKDRMFGFDLTYVDLARAMSFTSPGRVSTLFKDVRTQLNEVLGGEVLLSKKKKEWIYRDMENHEYAIALASEGIKRLSILRLLLSNHYLTSGSIIFIDEAEANLHPALVTRFMECVVRLAEAGIQFFISSHSYFVLKNLYILAIQKQMSIPVFSFEEDGIHPYDLKDGMLENPIVQESINIYRREIDL